MPGGRLTSQIRGLVLSASEQDASLKAALSQLQPVLGSDGAVAVLFEDQDHSFRVAEQVGLTAKQRRGLKAILPTVAEFANREGSSAAPTKSNGAILIFTEAEARQRGISSALVYYLVRSERPVGALVFCREAGQFDKAAIKGLDAVSALLALVAEHRFFKEKARDTAGFVNLDGLTGLYTHQYVQENLSNELLKSQRFRYKVSLLMIDIDYFKKINDNYGHPQGDSILREVSRLIKETIRAYDVPARYGGEEFAVVLPHADPDQALQVAERMRHTIASHAFSGRNARESLHVTVSIGLASYPTNAKTKAELIGRADQALYLAKSEGRNRVCLSLANSSTLVKVGFCPAALTSPYYRNVLAGMEDVTKEIKQIELTVRAPEQESDYRVLKTLFRQFVRDKVDAVAICTQSPTAVADLQILHRAKIPVYFFNVPQAIGDRKIRSYVGYNQTEAGKSAGELLTRLLRGSGSVAIVEGLAEPTNRQRVLGFKKALKGFPEITVVASEPADWIQARARKATLRILREHKNLDAIFATSDAMALGVVEAVKAKGLLGRVFIVGLDGTEAGLQSVKDGGLTATLNTRPRELGRILLRTIVRGLIKEEKVARRIESPINVVTAENVDQALDP